MKRKVPVERGKHGYAAVYTERGCTIIGAGSSLMEVEASLQDGIDSAASVSKGDDLAFWKNLKIKLR